MASYPRLSGSAFCVGACYICWSKRGVLLNESKKDEQRAGERWKQKNTALGGIDRKYEHPILFEKTAITGSRHKAYLHRTERISPIPIQP